MRVFYPVKLLQLVALWTVVYLLIHPKDICATRKPQELLSAEEQGCHALLTTLVFEGQTTNYDKADTKIKAVKEERLLSNETETFRNGTEAQETTTKPLNVTEGPKERQKREIGLKETTATPNGLNTTESLPEPVEASEVTMVMRACVRIVERDVLASGTSLDLYPLRTPLAMLVVEVIFIVIQYVKIVTSYDLPDQLTITLTNMVHGLLWLVSGLALLIFRLGWQDPWASGAFHPLYPSEYMSAELICWLNVLFLLLETTLFPEAAYHDLVLEERGPGVYAGDDDEVQRGCGTFKERLGAPLLGGIEE